MMPVTLARRIVWLTAAVLATAMAMSPVYAQETNGIVVLQSDKGTRHGAAAQMKGIALSFDSYLQVVDSTHDIAPFDLWEAAQTLDAALGYFPPGTVFVSAVDDSPLSERQPVVMLTESGHFIATPDNGTLTLVAENYGVVDVRIIEVTRNPEPGDQDYYTFTGRDVFVATAAALAGGIIGFGDVGPSIGGSYVRLELDEPRISAGTITGFVSLIHYPFGNLWTNIDQETFSSLGASYGDVLTVTISEDDQVIYQDSVTYAAAYPDVEPGAPLILLNNVGNMSLALSFANFAETYGVGAGPQWRITFER
ncbi:MAG: SAM-dependent chlorinase/fluorinase [Pseudomonadota bacterium]